MQPLPPLYNSVQGQMRVVGLMSGSGSNLVKILEFEKQLEQERGNSPYKISVIFSDTYDSNAAKIGKDFDLPVVIRDLKGYYAKRGKPRTDMKVREEFDMETVKALEHYDISVAAYTGYMSIATKPLIDAYLGINVHPADLSIFDKDGKRKYTGDHAVRDAILSGEKTIASTIHIIEEEVDYGKILMISKPIKVKLPRIFKPKKRLSKKLEKQNQGLLKKNGDWIIFPRTLLYLAEGRYTGDFLNIYFDGKPIPEGIKLK
ncbi:MAG: formyl transferase [Nanoarchaeota archaeon]|nr:formyl transferase [Nanoarchaeota archaeon]MCG2718288.1 formyl transferase [Nanoarchaeota archaeon]